MMQAQKAPGNISASARKIDGVQHTLSVWTDQAAMRAYLMSGAHRLAMSKFNAMATGYAFGYVADAPPAWDEVHELWLKADPALRDRSTTPSA